MTTKIQAVATTIQKENSLKEFADIIKNNDTLRLNYKIQFFDISSKTNYVINGLDGRSINILQSLSLEELERYKELKSSWKD
jgi:hypothetical protein